MRRHHESHTCELWCTGGRRRGRRGRGGRASWKRSRVNAWNWHKVLKVGLVELALTPERFWRTTLAEWRVMLDGLVDTQATDMRKRAWELSHLLVAAGCKPEKVTVAKLLGEKERPQRDPHARAKRDAERIFKAIHKGRQEG
ncbi:phage tail assembly chaperone [Edaphobacter albus]|uniref:phage tail assembly chaperone n=1 Tax=Edaphobacter sp. 4G125 TaxID=2763071 RepID=UPI001648567A|nr:phage tail assembly chaperone [Edaphobacter sp. 4G125]QNI38414.1 phage tail assembly chaperone [Edaphobacter sp. 4G125]